MPVIASTRATLATRRISPILIAMAILAAQSASAATLIARYTFSETSGPTRNDSVGINTVATETGAGVVYGTAPIPAGAYGDLTVGDTQLGATGGLNASGTGTWATAGNNEFGALTNDFTVMAWVRLDSLAPVDPQRIIGRTFTGAGGWSFGVFSGGKLMLTGLGVIDVVSANQGVTSINQWVHVAVAKSSATGVTFFVNGTELENQPTQTDTWNTSTDPWQLGALGNSERLVGLVDDIRVYDGALDAQGVREALETHGTLIANYTFGEAAGRKRYDFAGIPADASESGIASTVVYGAAPIPAGPYGSLDIAGNTFGANGGQGYPDGEWLTQDNNKLGALTNDFTVMAWVKPEFVSFRQRIIGRANPGSGGWGFGIEQGDDLSGAAFIFTGYDVSDAISTETPIQADTWQHLAATKSSTAGVSFYLNGNLVQRLDGDTNPWLASTDAWSLLGSTEPLRGNVDEVRVYRGVLDTQSIRDAASGLICRTPNLALPQTGTVSDDLVVVDDIDLIEDLNLKLDLNHTRVGDIIVTLEHAGTSVVLLTQPVGGFANCAGRDIVAIFDDSAPTVALDQCAATAPTIKGSFKANTALNAFAGKSLGGTWRLTVFDDQALNGGTLNRWCLQAQKRTQSNRIFGDAFE